MCRERKVRQGGSVVKQGTGRVRNEGQATSPAERVGPSEAERKRVAVELIRSHDAALRASARRYSLCSADAEDAYQRGIEILLRKAPVADPRQLLPWARTVIKHESLALRRARERSLAQPTERDGHRFDSEVEDWVDRLEATGPLPDDRLVGRELVDRSREAMAELKPDERRALTQLAEGYSYAEIGSMNGWTYTKVNRCLAEGRERLRTIVRQSESGERCVLVEPLISACADGELPAERVTEVENHLAACGRCRALLREYRTIPREVAALTPLFGLADSTGQAAFGWLREAWFSASSRLHGLLFGNDRGMLAALTGGAGRGSGPVALAKLTAICVGTAGGAAACVATGVVPGLSIDRESPDTPVRERPAPSATRPSQKAPPESAAASQPAEVADRPTVGQTEDPDRPAAPEPSPGNQVAQEFGAGGGPAVSPPPVSTPQATASASPGPVVPSQSGGSGSGASRVPIGGSGEFGP